MAPADSSRLAYWVDAFTDIPFGGNPAVVIPQAEGLSDRQMQQIAREVNCSETAFVLPATIPEADLRLRWFTPTQEVNLCGHATVATFHALSDAGYFNIQRGSTQILYVETRSGTLMVTVDFTMGQRPWIWLALPPCQFEAIAPELLSQAAQVLGYPEGLLPTVAVVDTLNQDLLLDVPQLHQLQTLAPDMTALSLLGKQQHWRGVCVYTEDTIDREAQAHLRFFAPQSGILEDPVTGSVSGPLALLLQAERRSTSLAPTETTPRTTFRFEQGNALNRPGQVCIELTSRGPKLGGQAITVIKGELYL